MLFLTAIQRITEVVQAIAADIKALYARAYPGQRDMTGYTGADVSLQLGEKAFYDCTAVTTLALRIATQNKQVYRLTIEGDGNLSSGTAGLGIVLTPNNSTAVTYSTYYGLFDCVANTSSQGSFTPSPAGMTLGGTLINRFSQTDIYTNTLSKKAVCRYSSFYTSPGQASQIGFNESFSNNQVTPITSLGTINFPIAFTGRVIVELISAQSAVPPSNTIPALYDQLGDISAVTVSSNTTTLNPADMTANTGLIIITTDGGDFTVHSLAGGSHKRRVRLLVAPSASNKVILPHNSVSGSATGKFFNPGGTDQHLRAGFENVYVWLNQVSGWVLESDAVGLFNATSPGLVTASGGGKQKYMRADGTWASPLLHRRQFRVLGNGAASNTTMGCTATAIGTGTTPATNTTNAQTASQRTEYLVGTASATAIASLRINSVPLLIGHVSNPALGGFDLAMIWGPATGVAVATNRALCGLRSAAAPTDVEPSTVSNEVIFGWDAADTTIQLMYRGTGAVIKVSCGANFPVPTADRSKLYECEFSNPTGLAQALTCKITDLETGATFSTTLTSNLPANTTFLSPIIAYSVGGTSSVIGIAVADIFGEFDSYGYN